METLTANLGKNSYPVYFSENFDQLQNQIQSFLASKSFSSVTIISHPSIAKLTHHFSFLPQKNQNIILIPEGEKSKNFNTVQRICEELLMQQVDRNGLIISIGGGIINDIAGFVSSIYKRGISFINIPTTLLSLVDSSIGGKNGISYCNIKNCIGTFHQPKAIFSCIQFLHTLPPQQFSSGMAEIIKYALLDSSLWQWISSLPAFSASSKDISELTKRCTAIKIRFVEADERELSSMDGRIFLNLGHTFGHAIETASLNTYSHGESVAIGLCCAAYLSESLKITTEPIFEKLKSLLSLYDLPTKLNKSIAASQINYCVHQDKKLIGNTLKLILLKSIGNPTCYQTSDFSIISSTLKKIS